MGHEDQKEEYLSDLKTIRDALIRAEERPIYEPWAFYVWGVLAALGGLVQFFWNQIPPLAIWLSVAAAGGFAEGISLVRSLSRISLSVLTPTIRKFYLSFIGITIALGFTVILLHRAGDDTLVPLALMAYLAVIYFLIAQLSIPVMYICGFAVTAAAIILYALALPPATLVLVASLTSGMSFIFAGIFTHPEQRVE